MRLKNNYKTRYKRFWYNHEMYYRLFMSLIAFEYGVLHFKVMSLLFHR